MTIYYYTKSLENQRVQQLYLRQKSYVSFTVMVKPLDDNVHNVVVFCTMNRRRKKVLHNWMNKNFQEQASGQSSQIEMFVQTKYVVKLGGNFQAVSGSSTMKGCFYPNRENFQLFQVTVLTPTTAFVDVLVETTSSEGKDIEEKLVCIPIELSGTPVVRAQVHIDLQDFSGFTGSSFLRLVCSHLEDEWTTLAILLGLSVRTVEIYRTNDNLSDSDKKFRTFEVWRDTCKQQKDFGVNQIAFALHVLGRDDLVELIQNEIKKWLESNTTKKHHFTDFYNWAEINTTGMTLVISDTDDPMPVSDKFFMLLISKFHVGKCGTINDIGLQMGLSMTDTERISRDVQDTNPEYRLLRMIVEARVKLDDIAKTFASLMDSLQMLEMDAAIKWAVSAADKWLLANLKGNYEAPFRQEIMNILRNLERIEKDDASGLQPK